MSAFPLLSRTVSCEMYNRLVGMLPPLADDSVEALIARDAAALAQLDALGPIRSAEEASLAATVVAADTHAHDALRSAGLNAGTLKIVMQCRSQAMMMLRTRARAVERLERLQSEYRIEAALEDLASTGTGAQTEPPPVTIGSAANQAADGVTDAAATDARAETDTAAGTVAETTPQTATETGAPTMLPEERARRRAAVTALYLGMTGRSTSGGTNNFAVQVSPAGPSFAMIGTYADRPIWRPAA